MTEVVMMQAAMFQLRAAMESIDDPFIRTQMRLAVGVLGNAIDGAANGVNAAAVNDIAFALNDVVAAAADAPELEPLVTLLQEDVDALKSATALPDDVVTSVRALQSKLKMRRNAIERQTYVENAVEPLPHPPEELRALLARGLGLLRHCAQHRLRQVDLLHFDVDDFHAPRLGVLIEDGLHSRVQRIAMREQTVELHFAEDRAECGLGELRRLVAVVEDFDHRAPRLDHAKEDDRVHLQRDVVARDDVLRRDLECFLPQRDANHAVDRREDQKDSRPFRLG